MTSAVLEHYKKCGSKKKISVYRLFYQALFQYPWELLCFSVCECVSILHLTK